MRLLDCRCGIVLATIRTKSLRSGAILSDGARRRPIGPHVGRSACRAWFTRVALRVAAGLLASLAAGPAGASAWNEPQGQGLVIVNGLFDFGTRSFDRSGKVIDTAHYQKFEATAYLEYGLTNWLQAIVQPAVDATSVGGTPGAHYTGFGTSAAGAQIQLPSLGPAVFALQGTFHVPASRAERNLALTGNTSSDTDGRGLVGIPFTVGSLPAFVEAEVGYRVRGAPAPDEVHVDLTAGLRPRADILLLVQSFTRVPTQPGSTFFPRSTYSNLEGSVVYDFNPRWAVQVGVFGTVAGRNALLERGLESAVWYRF